MTRSTGLKWVWNIAYKLSLISANGPLSYWLAQESKDEYLIPPILSHFEFIRKWRLLIKYTTVAFSPNPVLPFVCRLALFHFSTQTLHMQYYPWDSSFPSSSLFLLWSWGSSSDLCACRANVLPLSSGSRQSWLPWHRNCTDDVLAAHPSVICHYTEPTVRTLTHGLLDLKICALLSNWMLRLPPLKDRIHPLSPFLFNSHVFHNLTVFEHALFSIFSFYVQPLLFKKTKIKTITNSPSPHRHKIISSSDISSRSTFDYLP